MAETIWSRLLAGKRNYCLAAALWRLYSQASIFAGESSTPQYMTARIEKGNLRNTVTATGALQAVTTVQVGSRFWNDRRSSRFQFSR